MNEAINLHDLKMLHEICAEQLRNILTAPTQAERDNHEETYMIAFKGLIKTIKSNVLPLQEKPVPEAVTRKANVQNLEILCES